MNPVRRSADELRRIAGQGLDLLGDADADRVMAWAAGVFGTRLAVATSMQDGVLAHLASRLDPTPEVLFLDTGYHFPETLQTRDTVAARYRLRLLDLRPTQSVAEQDAVHGPQLFARDPDLCCRLRKTMPLQAALAGYDAWVTGLRRSDSATRTRTPLVRFDEDRGVVAVNPIAGWSDDDVADYIARHDIAVNPLLGQGYGSVGCAPCTRRVETGADPRSGRWAGTGKTECGIHLPTPAVRTLAGGPAQQAVSR